MDKNNAQERAMPINEVVVVEYSKDKMLGVIEFQEPKNDGRRLRLEEIQQEIKKKGITEGLIESVINEISQKRAYHYKYIIAKGKAPIDGENAVLTLNFDENEVKYFRPKQKEDGKVDFKELNTVRNVKKGDLLASKIPATEGENGFNVLGQVIKSKRGKDVRMPKGKNTELSADGLQILSSVDGKLEYDGHNIYINTVYNLNGDLDSSIGNIDFLGSVVIYGNVKSGYTIKAEGSVEVKGSVEESTIIAGSDIFLGYGMQGGHSGKLISGGNVVAKFIQNATVEARRDIITEAIMHSDVSAGNSIKVDSGKGTIVGGSASATSLIIAKSIGSPMGTVTSVQIGVPPSVYQKYKELEKEIVEHSDALDKVEKSIKFLFTKARETSLDAQKQAMLQKLNESRTPLLEIIQKKKHEYRDLSNMLKEAQDGIIKVSDKVYPGVKVTIGSSTKYIDDDVVYCTIRKVDGDISIGV